MQVANTIDNSVSQTVLTNMAEGTGGNYYHVNQADELYYIFDTIAEKADYYKEFHFYDHFGLDSDDYEWAPGFCDWFTLQHYDRFNGEHSPYITVVDVSIKFSGVIE